MLVLLRGLNRIIRNIARAPQFSVPAILVLALGIGGTAAVFGALRTMLFQDLPYRSPDRIVSIWWTERSHPGGYMPASWPLFQDLIGRLGNTDAVTGLVDETQILTGFGEPEQVEVGGVTPDFFRVFDVKPLIGNLAWSVDARQGAVLSETFWEKHFGGDPTVVGRSLELNGVSHPIIGVLPKQVRLRGKDVFIPFHPEPGQITSRYNCFMPVFARLRSGVSITAFKAELQSIDRDLGEAYGGNDLKRELHFAIYQDQLRSGGKDLGQLLVLASGVLLLMAVVNLSGQFLLRSTGRATETAVRASLGATRLQAIRSNLAEALVISFAGALLSMGVAWVGLQLLSHLVPTTLLASHPMELDLGLIIFALVISLGVCLLSSAVPGVLQGQLHLAAALKSGGRTQAGQGSRRIKMSLVAVQSGLALALLVSFSLLSRSLIHLHQVNLGMNTHDLTVFEIAPILKNNADSKRLDGQATQLESRLRNLPGVVSVGTVSLLPIEQYGNNYTPHLHGPALPDGTWIERRTASTGLFDALGVRLVQGRAFTEADLGPEQPTVAVVSRSTARLCWPGLDPLGQQLTDSSGTNWCTVVGVVDDIRNAGPKDAFGLATVYFPSHLGYGGRTAFIIRSRPGVPVSLGAIRQAIGGTMPGTPILKLRSMTDVLNEKLQKDLILVELLGFAGAMALVISLVGLYGAMAYSVFSRTREIGVRLSLGAQPIQILALILREGMTVIFGGAILGLSLSIAGSGAIAHFVYGVRPLDPLSLGISTVILLAGALAACFPPALSAAFIEPSRALNTE